MLYITIYSFKKRMDIPIKCSTTTMHELYCYNILSKDGGNRESNESQTTK